MNALGQINDGGGSMLIRKYLLIVLLCLTSLSTVGLGISTAVLDRRNGLLKNKYAEQSTSLQTYLKNQNNCSTGGTTPATCSSAYVIRNWISIDEKEEEITKYVKINMVNLTTSEVS